mgnify:CR=1 FL=1
MEEQEGDLYGDVGQSSHAHQGVGGVEEGAQAVVEHGDEEDVVEQLGVDRDKDQPRPQQRTAGPNYQKRYERDD